jgi:hypothetical protein
LQVSLLGVSLCEWRKDRRVFRIVAIVVYVISVPLLSWFSTFGQFALPEVACVVLVLWLPATIVLVASGIWAVLGESMKE